MVDDQPAQRDCIASLGLTRSRRKTSAMDEDIEMDEETMECGMERWKEGILHLPTHEASANVFRDTP
jgi:hypothetical protein